MEPLLSTSTAIYVLIHTILLPKPKLVTDDNDDPRWKYFKGYIGALDGTYINVLVSNMDKPPGDARVLRDAVTREDGLKVPKGNYFLCDNGYANAEGFLTPFKVEEALDIGTHDVVDHDDYADIECIDQVESSSNWNRMREDMAHSMWLNVCFFIVGMSTSTEDSELIPDCICGRGKMRLFCAGKEAKHSGRFFKNVQQISNILVLSCGVTIFIVDLTMVVSRISS
ncbi:protein ANTAGONIST OF LIKE HETEROCHROMATIN PROTEIN 1-like [Salvia divinorum]|uniref:Protein ANTAGONIST OF LIKE HETEROCHROMATIN PROTEIN 1-like n=1 Tax=Salvia divinorum TaxID=28513 RepID=A0ABD1IJ05_SALDI